MPKIKGERKLPERIIDNRNIDFRFLEIIQKFPFFTKKSIRRLCSIGITTSEILEGRVEGDFFIPANKYSCENEKYLKCFKISTINSRFWQESIIFYSLNQKNNAT